MGNCKPGTTCLYHGSQVPDADTSINIRSAPPGPIPIPYPNIADSSEHSRPQDKPYGGIYGDMNEDGLFTDIPKICLLNSKKNRDNFGFFMGVISDVGLNIANDTQPDNLYGRLFQKFDTPNGAAGAKKWAAKGALVMAMYQKYPSSRIQKPTSFRSITAQDVRIVSDKTQVLGTFFAIIVPGPLDSGGLPTAYWGKTPDVPAGNAQGLSKLFPLDPARAKDAIIYRYFSFTKDNTLG